MGEQQTPAGWYADPNDSTNDRYWDGMAWGAVRPRPPAPPPPPLPAPRKPVSLKLVLGGIVAFCIVATIASQTSKSPQTKSTSTQGSSTGSPLITQSGPSTPYRPTYTPPPGPSPEDLDPATYAPISDRDFALLMKNPDAAIGEKYIVYGQITQFDTATGVSDFRANTGPDPFTERYQYKQNTIIHAEDPSIVAKIVEDDVVTMHVKVAGSMSYDTTMGGKTTVPKFTVYLIAQQTG